MLNQGVLVAAMLCCNQRFLLRGVVFGYELFLWDVFGRNL